MTFAPSARARPRSARGRANCSGAPQVPRIGIVYLGLFATLAAMLCFGYGVARAGPVRGGIFTHLVPVFSVLFAVLFSDETLALYHVLGFVLVAGGAIVSCLQPPVESPPIVTTHPSHPNTPASNA